MDNAAATATAAAAYSVISFPCPADLFYIVVVKMIRIHGPRTVLTFIV